MEHTSTGSTRTGRAALGWLAVLSAVNLYRAMTLPVTVGEAWNFDRFIAPAWAEALAHFDVNNHVLNTLLVRISTSYFHLTELSLRLPSLLCGLLYLWAVYRLARLWFGSGAMFLAVVALLTLNPMVLDAMSEARGYGMGLGSWMWALVLMLESEPGLEGAPLGNGLTRNRPDLSLAGVCLGLSVVGSLAFAAPALGLLVTFLAWGKGDKWVTLQTALLTMFLLLVIPVNHMEWKTLAEGATSLRQTINEMIMLSLGTSLKTVAAIGRVIMAVLAVAGLAAAVRLWGCRDQGLVVLTGGTLAVTLVALLSLHRVLNTPFPQGGAVYLIPLTTLLVSSVITRLHWKSAQIVFLGIALALTVRYLAVFQLGSYAAGREFAGARTLAKTLRSQVGQRPARIAVSLAAEPILNYYRTRYRQGNWERIVGQPIDGKPIDGKPIDGKPVSGPYDYYVLTEADAGLVEQRHLHVIYKDAGLTLAH